MWGCFKHVGIPMETIMKMPIQDRRFYIKMHNREQEKIKEMRNGNNGMTVTDGEALNKYAQNEQNNAKVRGGKF